MSVRNAIGSSLLALAANGTIIGDVQVFTQSGDAASIQGAVDSFRGLLGPLNGNVPGSFGSGRREVNWDAVPDGFSSPNLFPPGFFNFTAAPRARGLQLATDGDHFEVSAKVGNPTATPVEFGNIDRNYVEAFAAFSAERIFAPVGSVETTVTFFVPGTVTLPAGVTGFGVVFTDADLDDSTSVTVFDKDDQELGHVYAEPAPGSGLFSFVALVSTDQVRIAKVVIRSGNVPLGPGAIDTPRGIDAVAMDDFIFGEPTNLHCAADLNGDGNVGPADLAIVLGAWGPVGPHPADFNGDGQVAAWDLAWLLGLWGPCSG